MYCKDCENVKDVKQLEPFVLDMKKIKDAYEAHIKALEELILKS